MSVLVILDFDKCATRTNLSRVIVNDEIWDWLLEHNREIPRDQMVNWLLGIDHKMWKVEFNLQDVATALLFKLVWGGS